MAITSRKRKKKKFGKTRKRLVLTYISIILLTLVFLSTYISASISQYLYNQKKIEVMTDANVVANLIGGIYYDSASVENATKQLNFDDRTRIIVTDSEAKVLYDSSEYANINSKTLITKEVISAIKGEDTVSTYTEDEIGTVVQSAVSIISNSKNVGAVYISTVAKAADDFMNDLKRTLFVISAVICILIGILSSVMADIIIGPVEKLTKVILNMQDGILDEKADVSGNDEVSELGRAFNTLTDKLNEFEENRRVFVSNASHELKTPLSSIKLLVDSILSMETLDEETVFEFIQDINGEIDRLTKIITKLLDLTKLDVKHEGLDFKVTDINEMAARVVKSLTPVAQSKNITLSLLTNQEVLALADREKFWQVIYNITDNAIKYTLDGGMVQIVVYNEDGMCKIEISDNGIGIPDEDKDKIFERFYRVDKDRARETGGTGLGLSIVKSVVEMHGGNIKFESKLNEGTRFTITIPKKI